MTKRKPDRLRTHEAALSKLKIHGYSDDGDAEPLIRLDEAEAVAARADHEIARLTKRMSYYRLCVSNTLYDQYRDAGISSEEATAIVADDMTKMVKEEGSERNDKSRI